MAMHSCIAEHVAQMCNLVTAINHDQPVRRLEHSETQLTYTSRSIEQREFTTGLYVGAAYVKNIWLGFLLILAYTSAFLVLYYSFSF